ncbi:hypothetical protein PYW07_000734 [Mythimna separata]|uniref:Enhancer of mRNA-decapping protein 4 WD40 repeat region domain-containing protein n=1 Tax=Mythimna separata TaxID=271217 RepID=A0AAD7YTM0_MYTSE|nr:hypothetical protein PYW07_000734 [Mythimna separata]
MAPPTMLPKLSDATQTISFSDGDGVCSAEVFSTNVMVNTNAGNHDHGSSKVKLKNLVDYNWEPKYYAGQLLAIHTSGKYLAYSIKAPNAVNPGTWSGMVRVVYNPEPGTDRRALIKGMKGEVQDLAFAYIQSQVVLACIDEQGNFYVHEIEVTDSGLRCTQLAEVREDTGSAGSSHRVVWCPYIPDDEDDSTDDDVARLLLTTHDNIARMWNTAALPAAGAAGAGAAGALCAAEHAGAIRDAAFSPDGSALATASADGYVMFFQVYMHTDSSPRCLHKWQPHGGKPLSCLFFLDNHKNYNTDVQFWKFAVTGADNNTTIKIWSCKSWTCLQSITFTPSVGTDVTLGLKAMLDTSASYLLLSDFKSRSLYVLNVARDPEDSMAYCKSISEFLLPYPVLSFCIVDAEEQQSKCEPGGEEPLYRNGSGGDADSPIHYELHPDDDDEGSGGSGGEEPRRVCVRLYIVQPKGLQEGRLVYTPPRPPAHADLMHGLSELALEDSSSESAPATIASSILQQQSQQLKNLLMRTQTQPGSLIGTRPESPSIAPQLNLMTPDAFSSPGKREEDDPPLSATPDVGGKARSSTGGACADEAIAEAASKLASAGSSPSREVQQIMSHNDITFFKEEEGSPAGAAAAPVENGASPQFAEPLYAHDDVFAPAPPEPQPLPPPPPPPHQHKLAHTNSETWPQISIPQIAEVPQRKASSDKSSTQSLNTILTVNNVERAASEDMRCTGLAPADRSRLEALEHKLDKLTGERPIDNDKSSTQSLNTILTVNNVERAASERPIDNDKSSTQSLNTILTVNNVERAASEDMRCTGLAPADRSRLEALEHKLDKLTGERPIDNDKSSTQSLNTILTVNNVERAASEDMRCTGLAPADRSRLEALEHKLDKLTGERPIDNDKSSTQSLNTILTVNNVERAASEDMRCTGLAPADRSRLEALEHKLDKLTGERPIDNDKSSTQSLNTILTVNNVERAASEDMRCTGLAPADRSRLEALEHKLDKLTGERPIDNDKSSTQSLNTILTVNNVERAASEDMRCTGLAPADRSRLEALEHKLDKLTGERPIDNDKSSTQSLNTILTVNNVERAASERPIDNDKSSTQSLNTILTVNNVERAASEDMRCTGLAPADRSRLEALEHKLDKLTGERPIDNDKSSTQSLNTILTVNNVERAASEDMRCTGLAPADRSRLEALEHKLDKLTGERPIDNDKSSTQSLNTILTVNNVERAASEDMRCTGLAPADRSRLEALEHKLDKLTGERPIDNDKSSTQSLNTILTVNNVERAASEDMRCTGLAPADRSRLEALEHKLDKLTGERPIDNDKSSTQSLNTILTVNNVERAASEDMRCTGLAPADRSRLEALEHKLDKLTGERPIDNDKSSTQSLNTILTVNNVERAASERPIDNDKSSTQSLNTILTVNNVERAASEDMRCTGLAPADRSRLEALEHKLDKLTGERPIDNDKSSTQSLNTILTVNNVERAASEDMRCTGLAPADRSRLEALEHKLDKLTGERPIDNDKSSTQSLNTILTVNNVERAASEDMRCTGLAPADRSRLEALEHKLDKLTEMMSAQTRELRGLRGAVASPREMVDEALRSHAQRTAQAVESALADGWERISRVGEAASARAATAAGVGAARALEPLAAALQHELASKLTATDALLRENIDKLANSKTIMERLSTSIAKSLSDMVRESFRAALYDSVVPVMEKSHQQIFKQINQAFQNGTKEFTVNTEAAARAAAERGGAAACAGLRAALERHAEVLSAAQNNDSHKHIADVIRDTTHSAAQNNDSHKHIADVIRDTTHR